MLIPEKSYKLSRLIGGHLLWKIVKGPLGSRVKGLPGLGDKRVTLMGPTCQGFLGLV